MDCREVKNNIHLFIDGELDDQTSQILKRHLSVCPLCKLELEQEERIDSLIRHNIPKEKAPYKLKEAILAQIDKLDKKRFKLFGFPLLRPIWLNATITFLIVLLISLLLININKPFPVFSQTIKDHIECLQGKLSIDISSPKPEIVQSWLQNRLDFKVMVPDLSSQGVNLLGARLCLLKNKKAAYLIYEKQGHNLSVFMFEAEKLKFPKAKRVAVNHKIFYLSKEKGYNSTLCIEEGIVCVFVSDLSEAELLHLASL